MAPLRQTDAVFVVVAMMAIALIEIFSGVYSGIKNRRDDLLIDVLSVSQLVLLLKPGVILTVSFLLSRVIPGKVNALGSLPFAAGLALAMIPADFFQYWYHRWAHESPKLWKLHLTHHSSRSFHVSLAFRENWLWFIFLPAFWWGALMVYLGLGKAYVVGSAIGGVHNVLIHNGFDWDRRLYRVPYLGKILRGFENIIHTPSQHRAHHGLGNHSAAMGNYSQLFFFWDVLFKTAHFPEENLPERCGITNDVNDGYAPQLWWPVFLATDSKSDLS